MKRLLISSMLLTILTMSAWAQSEDAVTVLPNGKVGINNSQPAEQLDVKGNVKVDGTIYVVANGQLIELGQLLTPTGTIQAYGGTAAPTGWLVCNGEPVSRILYAALFAAIGTAFGAGDGTTTFNLPDLRGMFLRGVDDPDGEGGKPAAGNDPDAAIRIESNVGGNPGGLIGSKQIDEYHFHNHTYPTIKDSSPNNGQVSSWPICSDVNNVGRGPEGSVSGSGGNETRPKNIYVNYLIKY